MPEATGDRERMSGTTVARRLLEELLTEEFFDKYWEKKPLHWRASERGKTCNRMPDALGVGDLVEVLVRAGPNLKMFRRGEPMDVDSFMVAYLEGASLIVNQADRCSELLFTMCRTLADRLFHHVFCVSYLTPPGSQAVRMHTDDQDVILLQVWGKKHWTLRNNPTYLPYTEEMLGKDTPVPQELIGEKTMEFTMEPHDALYIPRGYLHEADTSDEPSLHITVTMPTSDFCWGVQLVRQFMQQLPASSLPWLKTPLCASEQVKDDELEAQLQEAVRSWLSSLDKESVLSSFEGRMARTNEGQGRHFARNCETRRGPPMVTEDSRVRLMHDVSCSVDDAREKATFLRSFDGKRMEMHLSPAARSLVRSLTYKPQRVSDLPCGDAFERICLFGVLNRQGVVQVFVKVTDDDDKY